MTTPLLSRLGLGTRAARAWAMYDWANSAMVTLIVTAVFPIFYKSVSAAGLPDATATYRFGMATTLALTVSAVLSPLLGTVADFSASKKRYLAWFLALGVASTAFMFFLQQGGWLWALVLFMLANIGANGSFVFYDALLPHVAEPGEMDKLSTAGYALGYLGGGLLLVFSLVMIQAPGMFGLPHGEGLTPVAGVAPRTDQLPAHRGVVGCVLHPALPPRSGATGYTAPGRPGCGRRLRRVLRPSRGDAQAPAHLQAGLPAAGGVPDLQRWHRHHHPDGHDLRRGAASQPYGDDRRDRRGAVHRHSLLVSLRPPRVAHWRQAVDFYRTGRVRGDQHRRATS